MMKFIAPGRLIGSGIVVLFLGILFGTASHALSQEVGPDEPEIVLPTVLLELEDLSVESVTAVIPDGEELPPSELKFPLPETGELAVAEPVIELGIPTKGVTNEEKGKRKDFTVEAELGAGILNHFVSRISLYSLGEKPEGRLFFQHETLDGFSSNPPGKGYNKRGDQLEGGVKFGANKVRISAEGAFIEQERGLQGKGSFYSKINRFIRLEGKTDYSPGERFGLKGSLEGAATTQLLAGGATSSESLTEFLILPSISVEYRFKKGALGLSPRLSYRGTPDRDELSAARTEVRAYAGFDLNEVTRLEGGVGWHWGETTGHLFPFDLGLESRFNEYFSMSLKGGYRVEEMNLKDLFGKYHLMGVPSELVDNAGWFFNARANWIPAQGWILDAGIGFSDNSKMPTFDRTFDASTGLFPFAQEEAMRVSSELGLRWNITEVFSTRFGWTAELAEKPEFSPSHRFLLEGTAVQKEGKYGGGLTAELLLGVNPTDQAPVVGASGFVQATDFMRFTLEMSDLIYPLLDGPREDWYPYVEAGFTLTAKALIIF